MTNDSYSLNTTTTAHSNSRGTGRIVAINGNVIGVETSGSIMQNETAYVVTGGMRLKAEVVRIKGQRADLQVFEDTAGIKTGDLVEFTGELLSVTLGPGLLGQLYDGLQNPLDKLAAEHGFFLQRGVYIPPLSIEKRWEFTPLIKTGDTVEAGSWLGTVREGIFEHKIMAPFNLQGRYEAAQISPAGHYTINESICLLCAPDGSTLPLNMSFNWPVKVPITAYKEKLMPQEPLVTRIRIMDALFPVGRGGSYCIPGPFGAGKTILQQITSKNAQVDIVIIAACGERAGEVVEIIKNFPSITDPYTGRSLMERTIIVCNTSSMPVAARESSVYTAVTIAEYYRQMGLDVLLLADSTSRWAQAVRERSSRLEEIPGEEAFPSYLESLIANFYERAGLVRLHSGATGSMTIGGTISPAGGNFEEPVTQATLKVVGAFHGLSIERSNARRYPAIDPLTSWSKYNGRISVKQRRAIISLLFQANEISQMMKVIGEEGLTVEDYVTYLKGEFFDRVFLQQSCYDYVDAATSTERLDEVFSLVEVFIKTSISLKDKDEARRFFNKLRQLFLDLNSLELRSDDYVLMKETIFDFLRPYVSESLFPDIQLHRAAFVESQLDTDVTRFKRARVTRPEKIKTDDRENCIQQD